MLHPVQHLNWHVFLSEALPVGIEHSSPHIFAFPWKQHIMPRGHAVQGKGSGFGRVTMIILKLKRTGDAWYVF